MRAFISNMLATELVLSRRAHPELADSLEHLHRRGEVVSVLPGTYAAAGVEHSMEIRLRALALWDPDAVITGWAAARLTFWPGPDVNAIVAKVRHRRSPQRGFVFCRRTIPEELIMQRSRLRVTVPALTAVDLCTESHGDSVDQVLRTRMATLESLSLALEATKHRRGNQDRRRLLLDSRAEPWSAAERRFHGLLRGARITGWRANVPVQVKGETYFLDVAFGRHKLAIEIDGRRFHADDQFETDRHRQNALILEGWTVLRFTWAMLVEDPERVIGEVRIALAACGRSARL